MLQEELHQHGRQTPQMHPHPVFDSGVMTSITTPLSSPTDTMSTTPSTVSVALTTSSTDVPHAVFVYPTALLPLNNIDVVQVSYRTIWNSVSLTVFGEFQWRSNEIALARINQSRPHCSRQDLSEGLI